MLFFNIRPLKEPSYEISLSQSEFNLMSYVIHSLRLIWHMKSDDWKMLEDYLPFGKAYFQRRAVSFRGVTVSNVSEVRNSTKGKLVP